WSSDMCSSDLDRILARFGFDEAITVLTDAIEILDAEHITDAVLSTLCVVLARALRHRADAEGTHAALVRGAQVALELRDPDLTTEAVVALCEHGTIGVPDDVTESA